METKICVSGAYHNVITAKTKWNKNRSWLNEGISIQLDTTLIQNDDADFNLVTWKEDHNIVLSE